MTLKTIVLATALALSFTPAFAAEKTVKLSVPGMTCASCPYIVESAISKVKGVASVKSDLDTRSATVVYDDAVTNLDAITTATKNAGYESTPIKG